MITMPCDDVFYGERALVHLYTGEYRVLVRCNSFWLNEDTGQRYCMNEIDEWISISNFEE